MFYCPPNRRLFVLIETLPSIRLIPNKSLNDISIDGLHINSNVATGGSRRPVESLPSQPSLAAILAIAAITTILK